MVSVPVLVLGVLVWVLVVRWSLQNVNPAFHSHLPPSAEKLNY